MVFRAIILKRGYAWSALMICFDSELFPQNFVWQLNNDQKSLEPHRNCQIKSSKWLYFSFHMSQRIDNIQFYSYESIFLTNFKCSKHFALKKSSELWHSSSSRKGRPRIAAFQYYSSKDHDLNFKNFLLDCRRHCLGLINQSIQKVVINILELILFCPNSSGFISL